VRVTQADERLASRDLLPFLLSCAWLAPDEQEKATLTVRATTK
jgi:hypothetical protein